MFYIMVSAMPYAMPINQVMRLNNLWIGPNTQNYVF